MLVSSMRGIDSVVSYRVLLKPSLNATSLIRLHHLAARHLTHLAPLLRVYRGAADQYLLRCALSNSMASNSYRAYGALARRMVAW